VAGENALATNIAVILLRKSAISIRRSPIWNIVRKSPKPIEKIFINDIPNRRVVSADC